MKTSAHACIREPILPGKFPRERSSPSEQGDDIPQVGAKHHRGMFLRPFQRSCAAPSKGLQRFCILLYNIDICMVFVLQENGKVRKRWKRRMELFSAFPFGA
jgi:hypothetical protein